VIGLCTRFRDSDFKRSLAELPVGAEVEVEPRKGAFVLPDDASRQLVFVAGGIGITPFRSMLRYIEDERLPHRVTRILLEPKPGLGGLPRRARRPHSGRARPEVT
jgi:NAD(P)H-flavin reductase